MLVARTLTTQSTKAYVCRNKACYRELRVPVSWMWILKTINKRMQYKSEISRVLQRETYVVPCAKRWFKDDPLTLTEGRGAILQGREETEHLDLCRASRADSQGHCHPSVQPVGRFGRCYVELQNERGVGTQLNQKITRGRQSAGLDGGYPAD